MASPTQTVIGKGMPNPLTTEDSLKILRDLIPFNSPQNLFPIPFHEMVGPHKTIFISPMN